MHKKIKKNKEKIKLKYYNFFIKHFQKKNIQYNFYIHVQKGLCNRLRSYISAELIARKTHRKLTVIWQPDFHCEAKFNDLFKNKINVTESIDVNKLKNTAVYNCMDNEPDGGAKKQYINLTTNKDIYIRSAYSLNTIFFNFYEETQILKELDPVDEVLRLINNYDVSECIGIHVRQGGGIGYDKSKWDSASEINKKGIKQMHFWREKSRPEVFENEINKILEKNKNQNFFLAADHEEIYNFFVKRFNGNIIYLKRNCYDRSLEQQYYALADIYLLSKTKYILGSYWSSFTEIAQRLGNNLKVKYSGVHFGDIDHKYILIDKYKDFLKKIINKI